MSNAGRNFDAIELVDRVIDLIDKAKEGDVFAIDDARKDLLKLRKALITTTASPCNDAPKMRRCWRDSVTLYKWGQASLPAGSTLKEMHAWLCHQKHPYPGDCCKCRLSRSPANFARYVKAGLKVLGTKHRDRKAARA